MIDAGFTCPNRDGTVGRGGCTFCRTDAFCPSYCKGSITEQLRAGKAFFAGKYPDMKYMAYFQPYSNTHAPIEVLRARYDEALADPDVVGLVIATRPDCLPPETVDLLQTYASRTEVILEIGVESFNDRTLRRINRGHDAQTAVTAIRRCTAAGLTVGIHLIIGLPGETEEDILQAADIINTLGIRSLKLHQLQILEGTSMAGLWRSHPEDFMSLSAEAYADCVARMIGRLRPDIHIGRVASSAPSGMLIHPRWGRKPQEITDMMKRRLANRNIT